MAETTETRASGKLNGIAIGGRVLRKNHFEPRVTDTYSLPESWRLELSYEGGLASIDVSKERFKDIAVGSYQMFLVTQRSGKNGVIYNTAIEQ